MPSKKVLIVGAGPGGLAAAMLLANRGYQVEILEKKDRVGGRNAGFKLGEYTFDTGPTFFMMIDILENIFKVCGKNLHEWVKVKEVEPMYRLLFGGNRELMLSRDHKKMEAALEGFAPGSFKGFLRYLRDEKIKYDKLIPCLQMPYGTVAKMFSKQLITSLPKLDLHTSFYSVLGRYFDHPDVKTAFTFQAKYIGMSPWVAPGAFSIISFIEHGAGIYHVMGGLNQLSVKMAEAAQSDGAKLRLNTPIKKVLVEKGKAVGVELVDGTKETADYVLLGSDFGKTMTDLVDKADRRKWTDAKLETKLYSCSTFMLYLGVNKTFENMPHHNIIFADDYRQNVTEIVETMKLSEQPSFYVQNASVSDPSLAPAGKSALYILVPVPNNRSGIDWKKGAPAYREKLLSLIEDRGGFKGVRDNIEEEKMITPLDWEETYGVYKGATFNLGHNVMQMLYFRPHNEFEEFKNCYLAGGGTHPGSGLPTIYESGRISAELIMKRDGVL